MDPETKASIAERGESITEAPLKRAPTLYLIIFFKLIKGILAIGLAFFIYSQSAEKLPQEYKNLLSEQTVVRTFQLLKIHPENKFFTRLADKLSDLTDAGVRNAAIGAFLWSLFPLVEGLGLLFRASWAGWLAIVESAFFVPVEIYKLLEDFTWFMAVVTLTNVVIVWYLFYYRDRLFHHHLQKPLARVE